MKTQFQIVKETEKAMQLNISVSWADNYHVKAFWFPKSVISIQGEFVEIKDWFAEKLCKENTFNGYIMQIGF